MVDPARLSVEISPPGRRMADVGSQAITLTEFDTWESETPEFGSSFGRVRGLSFSADERYSGRADSQPAESPSGVGGLSCGAPEPRSGAR